jgi:hypothetical protein
MANFATMLQLPTPRFVTFPQSICNNFFSLEAANPGRMLQSTTNAGKLRDRTTISVYLFIQYCAFTTFLAFFDNTLS